jgi:hypothetical protein
MATKPVQIDEKVHQKLKKHSVNVRMHMGQMVERYIKDGIANDKKK